MLLITKGVLAQQVEAEKPLTETTSEQSALEQSAEGTTEKSSIKFQKLTVEIGETITLDADAVDEGVEISRKGIIDFTEGDHGKIFVTGLKKGIVALSWDCGEESFCKRIIEVTRNSQIDPKENPQAYPILKMVNVQVKVVLCKASQVRSVGVDLMAEGTSLLKDYNHLGNFKKISTFARFQQYQIKHEVIAEPRGIVLMGESLTLHSGGESLHYNGEKKGKVAIRPFGVMIEVQPIYYSAKLNLHAVKASLALSGDSNQGGRMGMHKLKTVAKAADGVDLLLGQSEFSNERSLDSSTPFLSSIPILGPIFRLKDSNEELDTVLFWLNLKLLK